MSLSHNAFLRSSLPVGQNVVKNIIFKASTIVFSFVVARLFAFIAFRNEDYISSLMFGESLIQKLFFVRSRKFNSQALLVTAFAIVMVGAGFYDTVLWALDSPGYVTKTQQVNAGQLSAHMVDNPGYLVFLSNPQHDLATISLNDTFGTNLYAPGLNFTLPGINAIGIPETVPAVVPLSLSVPPSIWLDSEGWAVGLDNTMMFTTDMNTTATACFPDNVGSGEQAWRCHIRNTDALALFDNPMGRPQIWWDVNTSEFLAPSRRDNPWQSLETGGDTAMMKQVFTLTKGSRRHTFLQTTLKAVMISRVPVLLDDSEITDFIRKTWTTTPPGTALPSAAQNLVNLVIDAKNNLTSLTFGSFISIGNTSVMSYSTDYLNIENSADESIFYSSLRFVSTTISLLRSEIVFDPPKPLSTCDQPYSNIATGGVVNSVNCYSAYLSNVTDQSQGSSRFLGTIDTSSVVILSGILGDGTKNTSDSALDPEGIAWYSENTDKVDQLLLSRGLILGGERADVKVNVQHNEAAISYLQLLLILLPPFFAIVILAITFRQPMSYYNSSFFAAVCATTHVANTSCEKVGNIHQPPDIILKSKGTHVFLGTPDGEIITIVGQEQDTDELVHVDEEPLLSNTESDQSLGEKPVNDVEAGLATRTY
ncbi:hypothetical protein CVT26_003145 [Gymnopilus dilepis]|uniref:Uncharacterized protein n=1 Tax=Gymnopilus dilepis TaxID=231916 RepID=A0A409W2P3_9AGAR|nr:hypothetical protein CVT26_003145 [Gymnopilus dilepis]